MAETTAWDPVEVERRITFLHLLRPTFLPTLSLSRPFCERRLTSFKWNLLRFCGKALSCWHGGMAAEVVRSEASQLIKIISNQTSHPQHCHPFRCRGCLQWKWSSGRLEQRLQAKLSSNIVLTEEKYQPDIFDLLYYPEWVHIKIDKLLFTNGRIPYIHRS